MDLNNDNTPSDDQGIWQSKINKYSLAEMQSTLNSGYAAIADELSGLPDDALCLLGKLILSGESESYAELCGGAKSAEHARNTNNAMASLCVFRELVRRREVAAMESNNS